MNIPREPSGVPRTGVLRSVVDRVLARGTRVERERLANRLDENSEDWADRWPALSESFKADAQRLRETL